MESLIHGRYFIWVGTALMLAFALAVLAFISFYKSRLVKIRRQETEFMLKATMELESKERKRVAADLHDSICGDLSAIRNYLAVLEQKTTDPDGKEILHEIKESVSTVLQSTKEISYNMMPPLIETSGLVPALEEHIRRIKKLHTVTISVKYDCEKLGLESHVAYEAYRIIQELLTNMLKFGSVTEIGVELQGTEKMVMIRISDNGIPFKIRDYMLNASGIGIKNIFSRLNYIGGQLIQLPYKKGNELQILIPLLK